MRDVVGVYFEFVGSNVEMEFVHIGQALERNRSNKLRTSSVANMQVFRSNIGNCSFHKTFERN